MKATASVKIGSLMELMSSAIAGGIVPIRIVTGDEMMEEIIIFLSLIIEIKHIPEHVVGVVGEAATLHDAIKILGVPHPAGAMTHNDGKTHF